MYVIYCDVHASTSDARQKIYNASEKWDCSCLHVMRSFVYLLVNPSKSSIQQGIYIWLVPSTDEISGKNYPEGIVYSLLYYLLNAICTQHSTSAMHQSC